MSWRIRRTVCAALVCVFPPAISRAESASAPGTPASGSPAAFGAQAQGSPSATFYEPPPPPKAPPPPQKPPGAFEMPAFSVRLDPFNWLLDGRLGLELELEVLPFMTVELVPTVIVDDRPPFIGQAYDDEVTQRSNGLGALAGTSVGLGFWFAGKPLRGNVFRVIFTNYGMTYRSHDGSDVIDELSHTERHLYAFFGSHSVYGKVFTLAGGIGLGMELNREKRCFTVDDTPTSDCRKDELLLRRARNGAWDLTSFSYPVELMGRISLGVTFF